MILTEEEAKTKWCPEARASDLGAQPVTINRVNKGPDQDCLCIGSACMAWRWRGDSPAFPGAGPDDELNPAGRRGYCGKAGKP